MTPTPNDFTSYDLSIAELAVATTLSPLQEAFIRNELSVCATKKVNVIFDPTNPTKFGLQVAYLDGQIASLRYLLAASDTAKEVAKEPPQEPSDH